MTDRYRDRVIRRAIKDLVPTRADRRQMRKWIGRQQGTEWRRFGYQSKGVPSDALNDWIVAGLRGGQMAPRPEADPNRFGDVSSLAAIAAAFNAKLAPVENRLIERFDEEE